MITDRHTLEYIFELVKWVKKPLVKIYPNGTIIGTDEQFASLNILLPESVNLEIDIPYVFRNTELSAFMRTLLNENGILKFTPYEIITKIGRDDYISVSNHLELSYNFDELYNKIISTENYKILYKEEDLQTSIPEMFSMKVSDGAKMFNINKEFLMTSFNAIHPATKTDRVELIIRDCDIYSYIAEFIIHKKKLKYQLHEYIRFRKL